MWRSHVFYKSTGSQERRRESEDEQSILSYSLPTYKLGESPHVSSSTIKKVEEALMASLKKAQSEGKEVFITSS